MLRFVTAQFHPSAALHAVASQACFHCRAVYVKIGYSCDISPDISWRFPTGRKWQFGDCYFSTRAGDEKREWRGPREVSRVPFARVCGLSPRMYEWESVEIACSVGVLTRAFNCPRLRCNGTRGAGLGAGEDTRATESRAGNGTFSGTGMLSARSGENQDTCPGFRRRSRSLDWKIRSATLWRPEKGT
jgi:hypothetical protein